MADSFLFAAGAVILLTLVGGLTSMSPRARARRRHH